MKLLMTVCAALVAAPAIALGCSPPQPGCNLHSSLEFAAPVPTDGVIAFVMGLEQTAPESIQIEVTDELGAAVTGALEVIHETPGDPGPPGGGGKALVAWRPDTALAPQSTYSLHVTCESGEGYGQEVDSLTSFETGIGPAAAVSSPVAESATDGLWTKFTGADLCCELETCWYDTCFDEEVCQECWRETTVSAPFLQMTLSPGAGDLPAHQMIYVVTTPAGDGAPRFDPAGAPLTEYAYLETDAAGPWCVTVRSRSLVDSTWSDPIQVCAGDGKTLPEPTPTETPTGCAEETGGEDIDAGSTDAGSTDAGSTDAGSTDAGWTDTGGGDTGAPDSEQSPDGNGPIDDSKSADSNTPPIGDSGGADQGSTDTALTGDSEADSSTAGASSGASSGCAATGEPLPSPWVLVLGAWLLALGLRRSRATAR